MKIKHYPYNAFIIENDKVKIAIDPGKNLLLTKLNSLIPKSEWAGVTHILVTHGDPDHFDYGLMEMKNELLERSHGGQEVFFVSIKLSEKQNVTKVRSHGTIKLLFGLIRLERDNVDFARGEIGFKITIGDKTVVNLGDTVLQEGWEGLRPDVLMIPIGGRVIKNTMGEKEALEAVKLILPKKVIPTHYNCDFLWKRNINPADDVMFKREVEKMGIECPIMKYGDEIII